MFLLEFFFLLFGCVFKFLLNVVGMLVDILNLIFLLFIDCGWLNIFEGNSIGCKLVLINNYNVSL